MKRNKILLAIVAASLTISAFEVLAAKPLKWGTGSKTGNYFSMTNDIVDFCGEGVERGFDVQLSGGSIVNLNGMTNKKYAIGIVQEDVLQYYSKQNPTKVNRNRMKIVAGMQQESVHVLLPNGYSPKDSGGWRSKLSSFVSGKKPVKGISLDLLKNQTIGSWGGSLVSAKALSSFAELNLNVVEVPEEARGRAGKVPILLVGGQPYGIIEAYLATGQYTLMPIDPETILAKAPFYIKDTLNYEVNGKIISVPSFGVRALLVAKAYRKSSKNADFVNLATCISNNLEDLADDSDTNPNWSSVVELEEAGQTNWSYFDIK